MARVIVVGSINQDITVTVDRFPHPGETLSGTSLTYGLGGKGANQAAAAAHCGVPVLFVGAIGSDPAGEHLARDLASHGVDLTFLERCAGPTGTALITVTSCGENTIILDAGANSRVTIESAQASLTPTPADIVVLQAEISEQANSDALQWAHSFDATVLLNLAPARPTTSSTMAHVDILVVNETEAALTVGTAVPTTGSQAIDVARALQELGPSRVMVTLGAQGAAWACGDEAGHAPALTLGQAVDTTGAGDACVGALAAALALGKTFPQAVADGVRAGSTAVLAPGAASSYAALPRITSPKHLTQLPPQ